MVKSKILIACDYPGWAYDNVSRSIIQSLGDTYNFSKIFTKDLPIINHHDFDVVYCMWWRTDFLERNVVPREKLCIQVASFWSWQNKFITPLEELVEKYLNRACCVSVNCPGLYSLINPLHKRVFLNPSGVDTQLFSFSGPRIENDENRLVVGWVGSSSTHGDNKGLFDIIYPACQSEDGIELKIVSKEEDWLPHDMMPSFYREIDVYLCASKTEGTPNPVLEAAASGKAVISTPVGIVPMLINDGYNGLIVDRSIDAIRKALIKLRDDRQLCAKMGINNRNAIEENGWDWKKRAQNYKLMFDYILQG